jgi:hypothetical protein
MKQIGKRLKKHPARREALTADLGALRPMVDDMRRNGGEHLPASLWMTLDYDAPFSAESGGLIDATFTEARVEERFSSMEKMLIHWIGTGQEPISAAVLDDYRRLLEPHDPLGLFRENALDPEVCRTLCAADLGTILDMDLIYSFAERAGEPTRVLEVGGGYGRLAEAMLNVFGKSIRYVMVDAVPMSMFYAKRYLAQTCPEVRLGSYYDGDAFDLDRFDCYIVPAWHFDALNTYRYDACVNILSFQEMALKHVDHYLSLFDRVAEDRALIYVANAHDGWFRGPWNYPKHWDKRFSARSPRRWSEDHPVEVFIKTDRDCSLSNGATDAMYGYWLAQQQDPAAFIASVGARRVVRPLAREIVRRVGHRAGELQKRLRGSRP